MRTWVEKTFYLAVFAVTLSSCTRAVSDKTRVTVILPDSATLSSKQMAQTQSDSVGALATSKWQVAIPSATALNCFAISVTIPEGNHGITCNNLSGLHGTTDLIFGGFTKGVPAEIEITPGPGREISLIGFYTDDVTKCTAIAETGGTFPLQNFSAPVYLSKVVKDIQPGVDNVELTIPATLGDPEVKYFEECSPKAFGPAFNVTATVAGIPSGTTSATSIVATVGGAQVAEYKYSIDPSTSCETAAYSNFVPITVAITESLTDSVYSVCVIGKTSSGDVQTTPTKKIWTVDTMGPAVSSITLSAAVGSNPYPDVTVAGTSSGEFVEVFKGPSPCSNLIGTATASATSVVVTPTVAMNESPDNVVTARITDTLGNVGACSGSVNYNLDTQPPTTIAVRNTTFGTSLYYTPLFTWEASSDSDSGVKAYEVRIDSGTWVNVGLNRFYFATRSFADQQSYSFQVRALDNADNYSTISTDTFFVDNSPLWNLQSYGKAVNADYNHHFGASVAIDGDFMVVGAPNESSSQTGVTNSASAPSNSSMPSSGAVYVYKRNTLSAWTQVAYLKAPFPVSGDLFGSSVAISKNTIVVGAPNESSTSTTIVNSDSGDDVGTSAVAVGAVYVFTFDGSNWKQQAYLKAPNAPADTDSFFGTSVAIDNDYIVVGAKSLVDASVGVYLPPSPEAEPVQATQVTEAGGAYIFKRAGTTWALDAYLKPLDMHQYMNFGAKVSISSQTVVVSAPDEASRSTEILQDDGYGTADGQSNGAVYVFSNSSGSWKQEAYIKSPNNGDDDQFGSSLDIFEDQLVVGAIGEDANNETVTGSITENDNLGGSGAAYVFKRSGITWSLESYLKSSNRTSYQRFGSSVAIWGSTILVGAPGEDSCTNSVSLTAETDIDCYDSGAVYAFQREPILSTNAWSQAGYFKASNNNTSATMSPSYSAYGEALDISGATVVIGNYKEAGSSRSFTNPGEMAPSAGGSPTASTGAIYIYYP